MPYLIDGHNLLGQMPGISLADPDDEERLVSLLKRFCQRRRKRATVIFDKGLPGGKSSLSSSLVEVRFASASSTADALIRSQLSKLPDPRNWTVVTSDHSVAQAARACGARVMPSPEFAAALTAQQASAEKQQPTLSKEDVEAWEAEFKRGMKKP